MMSGLGRKLMDEREEGRGRGKAKAKKEEEVVGEEAYHCVAAADLWEWMRVVSSLLIHFPLRAYKVLSDP